MELDKPVIATSGVGLAAACAVFGLVVAAHTPVVGPGRAIRLAISSYCARMSGPTSVRSGEVTSLKDWFQSGDPLFYRVIIGDMGVGKTCLLKSAVYRTPGVVIITADGDDSSHTIRTKVFHAIGKQTRWSIIDPIPAAQRTIACFRFMFRRSPIVVINCDERMPANLPGAVKSLMQTFNLRVVIDSSGNSVDHQCIAREVIVHLKDMSKEQIFSIPEIVSIFQTPEALPLADIAWKVLGGNPQRYFSLREHISAVERNSDTLIDRGHYIGEFLTGKISEAIRIIRHAREANRDVAKIIKLVREGGGVAPLKLLDENVFFKPDKLFKESILESPDSKRTAVIVPASNALDIVILYDISEVPTIRELLSFLS